MFHFLCPLCKHNKPSASSNDFTGLGFFIMRHFQATHPKSRLSKLTNPNAMDPNFTLTMDDGTTVTATVMNTPQ